jgi:hypothetical protein
MNFLAVCALVNLIVFNSKHKSSWVGMFDGFEKKQNLNICLRLQVYQISFLIGLHC